MGDQKGDSGKPNSSIYESVDSCDSINEWETAGEHTGKPADAIYGDIRNSLGWNRRRTEWKKKYLQL